MGTFQFDMQPGPSRGSSGASAGAQFGGPVNTNLGFTWDPVGVAKDKAETEQMKARAEYERAMAKNNDPQYQAQARIWEMEAARKSQQDDQDKELGIDPNLPPHIKYLERMKAIQHNQFTKDYVELGRQSEAIRGIDSMGENESQMGQPPPDQGPAQKESVGDILDSMGGPDATSYHSYMLENSRQQQATPQTGGPPTAGPVQQQAPLGGTDDTSEGYYARMYKLFTKGSPGYEAAYDPAIYEAMKGAGDKAPGVRLAETRRRLQRLDTERVMRTVTGARTSAATSANALYDFVNFQTGPTYMEQELAKIKSEMPPPIDYGDEQKKTPTTQPAGK